MEYRSAMETFKQRRRYMEKIIASLNNELCEDGLTHAERVKLYRELTTAVKVVNETQRDAKIEEVEYRITALEQENKEFKHGK